VFNPFRSSVLFTECDECNLRKNMSEIGACARCKRVLCNDHLHGSFARRLLADAGLAEIVCLRCRARSAS